MMPMIELRLTEDRIASGVGGNDLQGTVDSSGFVITFFVAR